MEGFDFNSEAELFATKNKKSRSQSSKYQRFERAADAVRFAIEVLPSQSLVGTYLEVNEQRFDAAGIRRLYDSAEYPLARPVRQASDASDARAYDR
jgi:hypothetical protein